MRARATQEQVFQRRGIVRPAWQRPHEEQLIEADIAVEDVAFSDAEAVFQIQRRDDKRAMGSD